MPFLDTDNGRAYYRHWAAASPAPQSSSCTASASTPVSTTATASRSMPRASTCGPSTSSGTGSAQATAGTSRRSRRARVGRPAGRAREGRRPGLPLVAQGHSFGAVATLWKLIDEPSRYRAGVISGAPLVPVPGLVDADSTFEIAPSRLSADPFYLDLMEHDPLAFVDADGGPLARELDRAWDTFGATSADARGADARGARQQRSDSADRRGEGLCRADRIAARCSSSTAARHDILNDDRHREVAAAIVEFVEPHIR